MKIICKSVKDCRIAAEKILEAYPEERVFAFYGKMGSGKTTLITAFCKRLGAIDIPKSPSFALINEYSLNSSEFRVQSSELKNKNTEKLLRTPNYELKTNKNNEKLLRTTNYELKTNKNNEKLLRTPNSELKTNKNNEKLLRTPNSELKTNKNNEKLLRTPNSKLKTNKNNEKLLRTPNSELKTNKIFHFDFYRIQKEEEAFNIGFEEYIYSNNYCFIEWAEKIENLLPEEFVEVKIVEKENMERIISVNVKC